MAVERLATLDLSTRAGFAFGAPGRVPRSGTVKLKDRSDPPAAAARNLGCFLRDQFTLERPDLVVYEAAFSAAAMLDMGNSSRTADLSWQLVGAVEAVCGCYGIRTETAHVQTVRKHFTGKGQWGGRDEAKRQTIARCHLLRLFPTDCRDDNRADACAIFDWASHALCKVQPKAIVMFGEAVA